MTVSLGAVLIGVTTGLTYSILGVGLVLVYRSARVVNFAHGETGAISALLLAKAVTDWGLPYWVVLPFVVLLAAAIGALVEVVVVRRLFNASRLVLMVATIGASQLLFAATFWNRFRPDEVKLVQEGYPTPFTWRVDVGNHVLRGPDFMILLAVPVAAIGLGVLLRYTALGQQIRASSSNPEAALMAGISTRRVSTIVWALAGALAALTAILLAPSRGESLTQVLGAPLMVRALAVALVGRMTNFGPVFVAGIGLGIVEQLAFANFARGSVTELVVFVVMIAMLLWRAGGLARVHRGGDTSVRPGWRVPPLSSLYDGEAWVPWLRRVPVGLACLLLVILPALPGLETQSKAFLLTQAIVFGIAALSLVVVTGMSGQLSLGQFALVGVGAYAAARLDAHGFSFPAVALSSGVMAAIAAVLIGLPALRIRGLFLAVSTLGFAVVASGWLFHQGWVTGGSSSAVSVGRPRLPGVGDVTSNRGLYYVGLVLLAVLVLAVRSLQRSTAGLRLAAARDNARHAQAHGIAASSVNLASFAVAGFVAGAGGALWAYSTANFDGNAFAPSLSVTLAAVNVIGGVLSIGGTLAASALVLGVPLVLAWPTTLVFLLAGLLLLTVLLAMPGGLVTLFARVRDLVAEQLHRSTIAYRLPADDAHAGTGLVCDGVSVRFGGITALDNVSLRVEPGEIVGLIGSNGAGKTTLMDCISGFIRPQAGRIWVHGSDLAALGPEYRAYRGVGRTFQDARLYEGLTVEQTIVVAQEQSDHPGLMSSLLGAPWERWHARRKAERADEVLELLGLSPYRTTLVGDLPTGIRRLCDLAATIVQRPKLLLLDEPTAGIAHGDVQQWIPMLRRVRDDVGCAILLIEHDMSVVFELADRVYALEAGSVLAEGTPAEVASNPAVVATYLGGDARARRATATRATAGRSARRRVRLRSAAGESGDGRGVTGGPRVREGR